MLTRGLLVSWGSLGPAWVAWELFSSRGIMVGFLCALIAFALGWYLSRQFVSKHLDY